MLLIRLRAARADYAAFLLTGYALVACLAPFFGELATANLTIAYRVAVIVGSVAILVLSLGSESRVPRDGLVLLLLFLIFWWLYLLRLSDYILIDAGWISAEDLKKYVYYPLGIIILPSTALIFRMDYWATVRFLTVGLLVLVLALGLGLYFSLNLLLGGLSIESGRIALEKISPIQFGKYAGLMVIVALALLRGVPPSRWNVFLGYLGLVLGIVVILVAGSRTAFVALAMVLAVDLLFSSRNLRHIALFGILFLSGALTVYAMAASEVRLLGVERFFSTQGYFTESTDIRVELFAGALHQFSIAPLFGDYYIERVIGFAPHNLTLEILMSMGIAGLLMFLAINGWLFYMVALRRASHTGPPQIIFRHLIYMYLYLFIGACFSAGITTAFELWYLIFILGASNALNLCYHRDLQRSSGSSQDDQLRPEPAGCKL